MKFTLLPVLVAASALAEPSPLKAEKRSWADPETGYKVDNLGYQGDGIYVAIFDKNNTATVQFTPVSDANLTATDIAVQSRAAPLRRAPKYGVTCTNSQGYFRDLDKANVMLANNAENHGAYSTGAWGWAVSGGEVSYFCVYEGAQYLRYNQIIERHTSISRVCGDSSKYGWDRCKGSCGFLDTAVGRTHKGNTFCTPTFQPL